MVFIKDETQEFLETFNFHQISADNSLYHYLLG